MWGIVLLLALGAATDPLRIGLVILAMSGRRPIPNLLAFWLGGMTAGIGLAIAVLILAREAALGVFQNVMSTAGSFVRGPTEIALGVLALLSAAVLVARRRAPVAVAAGSVGDAPALAPQPSTPTAFGRMSARARDMLAGGLVWPAFVVGLGQVTPPTEIALVFTVIMASGAAIGTQVSAFVAWTVVVLAVVEIPLVSYCMSPGTTQLVMTRLHSWVSAHTRQMFEFAIAVTGAILMYKGLCSL